MTATQKYLILTAGLLLIYIKSQAKGNTATFTAFSPSVANKLQFISNTLQNAGINSPQLNFALAQMLFETDQFSSRSNVATLDNNYSGIAWINKPYQVNAVRGSARPASEGGYYAKFNTLADWARDFSRILNLWYKPIEATTLPDYVTRLAQNNYFDVTRPNAVSNYYNGLLQYTRLLTGG